MTDERTDGRTDRGNCNIPDAFLKKRADNKLNKYINLLNNNDYEQCKRGTFSFSCVLVVSALVSKSKRPEFEISVTILSFFLVFFYFHSGGERTCTCFHRFAIT